MDLTIVIVVMLCMVPVAVYSIALQKRATQRQASAMDWYKDSIERQKQAIQLQQEGNELLREILSLMKQGK